MGLSFSEILGVGIISAAIFVMLFLLLIGSYGNSTRNNRNYSQTSLRASTHQLKTSTKPFPGLQTPSYIGININVESFQPATLFHGTTRKKAMEIHRTGLWLIGNSLPYAVWMGDKIGIAKMYSGFGKNGAIVVINADSDIKLINRGGGVYIYEIPDAVPNQEYYKIDGLTPIDVVDYSGKSIIKNIYSL